MRAVSHDVTAVADSPAAPPVDPARRRAWRMGTRLVLAVFVGFVVVFILTSTYEIVGAAHGFYPREGLAKADAVSADIDFDTAASPDGKACAAGVRRLLESVDEAAATVKAEATADEAIAVARFRDRLAPAWADENRVSARCASVPRGHDAFAALLRLRRAEEGLIRRQVVEIAPIHRDVTAYLPH